MIGLAGTSADNWDQRCNGCLAVSPPTLVVLDALLKPPAGAWKALSPVDYLTNPRVVLQHNRLPVTIDDPAVDGIRACRLNAVSRRRGLFSQVEEFLHPQRTKNPPLERPCTRKCWIVNDFWCR